MRSASPDGPRVSIRFVVVAIPVLSAALSGILGVLAGLLYPSARGAADIVASAAGAALGLGVALAWNAWMRSRAFERRRAAVVLHGALGGLLAGSLASFALHAFLQLRDPTAHAVRVQLFGQAFGIFFGLLLGLLGGALWNASLPPRPAPAA